MRSIALLVCGVLSGWLGIAQAGSTGEVNLYSARQEQLIKPLLDKFTAQTGITVNLLTGDADTLLRRLQTEGAASPADMLITVDAGRLFRAETAGVLQPVESEVLEQHIPAHLRHPEGLWFGMTYRARTIMYVKERVKPEQLSTYENLATPQWRGKICVRSSNSIYNQSMLASMVATEGAQAAEQWAKGLVANFARRPQGGDRDQVMAAASGQCDLVLANTYYLAQMMVSDNPAQQEAAGQVAVFWPNQSGRGVHVNISGAALTKSAKNRANALQLLEFMVTPEAQQWYAQVNHEYPVRSDVPASDLLRSWGTFKADSVNLTALGVNNPEAVRIMDRAGWR